MFRMHGERTYSAIQSMANGQPVVIYLLRELIVSAVSVSCYVRREFEIGSAADQPQWNLDRGVRKTCSIVRVVLYSFSGPSPATVNRDRSGRHNSMSLLDLVPISGLLEGSEGVERCRLSLPASRWRG